MKLLTAAAAGLAACAVISIVCNKTFHRSRWLLKFRCWLCKHVTVCVPGRGTVHRDCRYCGISNKLAPGATAGQLPDIDVSLL